MAPTGFESHNTQKVFDFQKKGEKPYSSINLHIIPTSSAPIYILNIATRRGLKSYQYLHQQHLKIAARRGLKSYKELSYLPAIYRTLLPSMSSLRGGECKEPAILNQLAKPQVGGSS